MLSSYTPSTPIRTSYNDRNNHQSIKIVDASPRSVQQTFTPKEMKYSDTITSPTKAILQTPKTKTVEGQVSFRTATRRFSNHATVVIPSSPMCIVQKPPKAPNTTGSAYLETKVRSINHTTTSQSRTGLPTMEPLDVEVDAVAKPKRVATTRVQRDVSFRTLAQRFATTKSMKSAATNTTTSTTSVESKSSKASFVLPQLHESSQQKPSQVFQKQQRRSSTGYYDFRMVPSIALSNNSTVESNTVLSPKPFRRLSIQMGAAINDVPSMSPIPSTTTTIYTPLSSSPVKKASNDYLTNNKVFQKRYNAAATSIQRVYRGHKDRYDVARMISAVRIQNMIRQYLQQRTLRQFKAVTSIQKTFRGFATRLRSKVYQLEYQLHQIQQSHARELLEIQQRKEKEIKSINKIIGQEQVKYIEEKHKQQKTIDDANRIIQYLRKENKKVRDKNEALRVAIDQLIEENDMLERQAQEYKVFAANLDRMKMLNHENAALISVVEQFELRKQQFDEAIEKRDEFIMLENQMGRLYLHQIQRIVSLVETDCVDPYLIAYVEELCIKCNAPGTGLDAAVSLDEIMDLSERQL